MRKTFVESLYEEKRFERLSLVWADGPKQGLELYVIFSVNGEDDILMQIFCI